MRCCVQVVGRHAARSYRGAVSYERGTPVTPTPSTFNPPSYRPLHRPSIAAPQTHRTASGSRLRTSLTHYSRTSLTRKSALLGPCSRIMGGCCFLWARYPCTRCRCWPWSTRPWPNNPNLDIPHSKPHLQVRPRQCEAIRIFCTDCNLKKHTTPHRNHTCSVCDGSTRHIPSLGAAHRRTAAPPLILLVKNVLCSKLHC